MDFFYGFEDQDDDQLDQSKIYDHLINELLPPPDVVREPSPPFYGFGSNCQVRENFLLLL